MSKDMSYTSLPQNRIPNNEIISTLCFYISRKKSKLQRLDFFKTKNEMKNKLFVTFRSSKTLLTLWCFPVIWMLLNSWNPLLLWRACRSVHTDSSYRHSRKTVPLVLEPMNETLFSHIIHILFVFIHIALFQLPLMLAQARLVFAAAQIPFYLIKAQLMCLILFFTLIKVIIQQWQAWISFLMFFEKFLDTSF